MKPQVVILCGGAGTRLREETEYKPKPLVEIGGMPILWHIMKIYSHFGFRDFILCLGYKGSAIKEYFLNFEWLCNDFTLNLRARRERLTNHAVQLEDWKITFADTGIKTPTGGRVKKIEKYITGENFFLTYGDGLSDVNINDLYAFHRRKGKIATLTAIHPMSPFGTLDIKNGLATSFKEKPRLEGVINGGFFAFTKKVFNYLKEDSILEEEPLRRLSDDNQLTAYEHRDFWMCMDTFKDVERMNAMWEKGDTPWVIWDKKRGGANG